MASRAPRLRGGSPTVSPAANKELSSEPDADAPNVAGPAYHRFPIRLEYFTIDEFLRTLFPEARRCPHV
jgi:hypothetical protein